MTSKSTDYFATDAEEEQCAREALTAAVRALGDITLETVSDQQAMRRIVSAHAAANAVQQSHAERLRGKHQADFVYVGTDVPHVVATALMCAVDPETFPPNGVHPYARMAEPLLAFARCAVLLEAAYALEGAGEGCLTSTGATADVAMLAILGASTPSEAAEEDGAP